MRAFLVNRFVFQPVTAGEFWEAPPAGLAVEEVVLEGANRQSVHAWWSAPAGWMPEHGAVLYCHGNAGNVSMRGEAMRRWQNALGVGVLIFDYPGYGKSEGKPTEAGCYAAGNVAYDWIRNVRQVRGERIILYGGSLGGGIAIDLAVRQAHRALVLVSAFTSVRDMGRKMFPRLPIGWLVPNSFDNLAKIARVAGPVMIAHGTGDRMVPFAHGERLFAAAREPKAIFPMVGYDHHHAPGPDFYEALKNFLASHAP